MTGRAAERRIGPERGRLVLHTAREGLVARAGHDLTIEMTRWSGQVRIGRTPAESALSVSIDMGSMRILAATGGLRPLTGHDEREILRNARRVLCVDRHPEGRFVADEIGEASVEGRLTLLGRCHPLRLTYRVEGCRCCAFGSVRQSDHGIRPYSAMFGTLAVADLVRVEAELELPEPHPVSWVAEPDPRMDR